MRCRVKDGVVGGALIVGGKRFVVGDDLCVDLDDDLYSHPHIQRWFVMGRIEVVHEQLSLVEEVSDGLHDGGDDKSGAENQQRKRRRTTRKLGDSDK